jgi:pimeloyl-ACP methyl ester carboxylesterase
MFEPVADLPYLFANERIGTRGWTMEFVRQTIEINGCKLSLARGGKGVPLMYLHGTDGLADWPAILDTLAERFDVIVPDHPGFGASEAPGWIDDISDVAYCYLDAIEVLGLSGVHVVGQSLGGWIALEMAVRSTQRLRSLTLISSAGIHVKGVPKTDIFIIDPEEQARLAYVDAKLGEEAAARAGADKYQDLAILNRIASARFGWQPRFFNPRLERWLHRVNVPTHVIWGDGDRIIPPAYAEAFHRLIPGSTLTMIPNAGHLPHVERAAAVAQAMQTFLRN